MTNKIKSVDALCFHKAFHSEPEAWRFAVQIRVAHNANQVPKKCWHCDKFRLIPTEDTTELEQRVIGMAMNNCARRATFPNAAKAEAGREKAVEVYGKQLRKFHCAACGLWHLESLTERQVA